MYTWKWGVNMKKRKLTSFGREIKKALIDKGMTQVELANRIGTSAPYLNHIMYGEKSGEKYISKIIDTLDLNHKKIG
mgnify:CR=1 FL=1